MQDHTKWADGLFGLTGLSFLTGLALKLQPILQDLAFIATIVAAIFATYYHWKKSRKLDD